MDFKALALTATLGGTVLFTGLTFTGTINLGDIKSKGFGWADKVTTSVNETKDMLAKFNIFKGDVTALLNEKIAKVNELNAKIADLNSKVGDGQVSLESANNEIARLNTELEKANNEIQALKDEYNLKDAEVAQAYAEIATAEDMNTTLTLDQQNADTVVPADTTTTETTTTTTAPDYNAQATAIKTALTAQYTYLAQDLIVTVDATTVTLNSSNINGNQGTTYEPKIESALGKQVTYQSGYGTDTFTYTIN